MTAAERCVPFEAELPRVEGVRPWTVRRSAGGQVTHTPPCSSFLRTGWCSHLEEARQRAEEPDVWVKARLRAMLRAHTALSTQAGAPPDAVWRSVIGLREALREVLAEAQSNAYALVGHERRSTMGTAGVAEEMFARYVED